MPASKDEDLVTIIETADVNLLAVFKSILLGAEISFLVQGEEALSLLPLAQLAGPLSRRGLAVAIMVAPQDEDVARELLSEVGEP
jgi:hypothetical protein